MPGEMARQTDFVSGAKLSRAVTRRQNRSDQSALMIGD